VALAGQPCCFWPNAPPLSLETARPASQPTCAIRSASCWLIATRWNSLALARSTADGDGGMLATHSPAARQPRWKPLASLLGNRWDGQSICFYLESRRVTANRHLRRSWVGEDALDDGGGWRGQDCWIGGFVMQKSPLAVRGHGIPTC
jgi:hypothetical protein